MKTGYKVTKGLLLGVIVFAFSSVTALAQIDDVSSILQAGKTDANILVQEYLKPYGRGLGSSLNSGWTNTARPHKTLGLDITISAGLAVVPDADAAFNVAQLDLTRLQYENGPLISPTIAGDKTSGSVLADYVDPDMPESKFLEFTMPKGTGFQYAPAPMIKAGLGLFKGTEVMVRYLPQYEVNDFGSFELWGVGLKHDIKQWLPGGKLIPVDLSVMFGYTYMDLSSDFSLTAEQVITNADLTDNPYAGNPEIWAGQGVTLNTEAYTINALVGKTLPVISIYGGVGYEASTFSIKTPGVYPTVIPNQAFENDPGNNNPFIVDAVEEPISVEIDGKNGLHALAGFRFRFAIFHISGSYKLANYSTYNLGFGISFR